MLGVAAQAAPLFVSFDNFNYSGSVSRFATLADAQNGVNAISTTSIATATNGDRSTLTNARDGNLYVANAAPGYDPSNLSYFSTAWYFTTFVNQVNGWGNPNNSNNGFVQYYDRSTAPTVSGGWSNGYTRFNVQINGGDGDSLNAARLWAAPKLGGPSGDTAGKFIEFALSMTVDFGAAATLNGLTGWYESTGGPTAVSGGASGIFQNDSTTDTSLNGYYAFSFTFAPGSWAADNGATWGPNANTRYGVEAFFAAPSSQPVSLPGTLALAALGLGLLGMARRRG
jgi:hypothetical protein